MNDLKKELSGWIGFRKYICERLNPYLAEVVKNNTTLKSGLRIIRINMGMHIP